MKRKFQAGEGALVGIIILAILLVVIFITPKNGPGPVPDYSGDDTSNPTSTSPSGNDSLAPDSSYSQNISIGSGNAARAYQPYEEYITITNRGRESINITNWQLKNAKDKRPVNLGGNLQYYPADTAIIPRAALFISPTGANFFQDIVLQPGEKAVIVTGKMGSRLPYEIVSFKENICSGYLQEMDEYSFTPALERKCPRPVNESGLSSLDIQCRKFVERMGICRIPEFNTRDKEGNICSNCVNGELLSSSCVAFIKSRFSYSGCIANHANDPNFSGKTWRIFLGKGWEMWAKEYETISLFDNFGRLVNFLSY